MGIADLIITRYSVISFLYLRIYVRFLTGSTGKSASLIFAPYDVNISIAGEKQYRSTRHTGHYVMRKIVDSMGKYRGIPSLVC